TSRKWKNDRSAYFHRTCLRFCHGPLPRFAAADTKPESTLAEHADRTEFHCSREFIAAAGAGALWLCAHGPNRPSEAIKASQRAWISSSVKPGRLAAGSVDSVPDPGGPVRLDQWGAFNLDGCGPRPSSQGDCGKEIRRRFWTQSHDRGPRKDYRQFPNCCA